MVNSSHICDLEDSIRPLISLDVKLANKFCCLYMLNLLNTAGNLFPASLYFVNKLSLLLCFHKKITQDKGVFLAVIDFAWLADVFVVNKPLEVFFLWKAL